MSRPASTSSSTVHSYLSSIKAMPVLSREEELALARAFRETGDEATANQLIESHLRAVVAMARKYGGYGIPLSDLIAEGNLGLIEAARRFEPERNLRFFTYARHWIRAYILAYVLRQWSIVDMGKSAIQSRIFFRLQAEKAKLDATLGDDGAAGHDATLAEQFHTSEDNVRLSLHRLRSKDASLDAPLAAGGTSTFLDLLRDQSESQEERAAAAEMAALVREAVANVWPRLDERERDIVRERLMPEVDDGVSLASLGRRMGVTRERVRQIEVGLKAKLRCEVTQLTDGPQPCGEVCACAA